MPVILAPAIAPPGLTGTTTAVAPPDQFASFLTALTETTGPENETVVLDPSALTAVALATATVPPAVLPTPVAEKAKGLEPVIGAPPSAKAFAPGQVKPEGTPATQLAPGHVKLEGESAKAYAPGHVSRATPAEPPLPPAESTMPLAPVTPMVPVTAAPPEPSPVPVVMSEPTHTVRPAIAAAAKRLTQDGDRTSLVVRLDPPELGAVLVRLTVREGQVEVTLRAPDLAAQGGLLAQAPEIQQVLREAGLDLRSFDVSYGELSHGQSEERQETPDRGTPRQYGSADGTVHVTDDVTDPQPAGTWL